MTFDVAGEAEPLTVYTTRPDTLMGVTYMAVAAEHPLAMKAAAGDSDIAAFIESCRKTDAAEATLETMEKKGMPLGIAAIHPLTGDEIPLWVANFVLMSYGTGAVMAVPAHDARDWEFAKKHGVPIKQVIAPADGSEFDVNASVFVDKGVLVNSGEYDGLDYDAACSAIAEHFEQTGRGRRTVNYRLRDWGVSRQRYWGAPIPIIYCDDCGAVAVPENQLPVVLPEDVEFTGRWFTAARHARFFTGRLSTVRQSKHDARRTRSTRSSNRPGILPGMPVPIATTRCSMSARGLLDAGGSVYRRHRARDFALTVFALFPAGDARRGAHRSFSEPFTNLLTQGMVLKDGAKMSKAKGNTVDPQELIGRYGADTVRLFMMFAAPPEQALEWSDDGVQGSFRFLKRFWNAVAEHVADGPPPPLDRDALNNTQKDLRRKTHQTIAKISDDIGRRNSFNTAVAAAMELLNAVNKSDDDSDAGRAIEHEALEAVVLMLSPIVPHICHALWQELGHGAALIDQAWPAVDESALELDLIEMVVQVNGKLRARISVPADADSRPSNS